MAADILLATCDLVAAGVSTKEIDRAAAEFMVRGKYLATADGLPPATGQEYRLPAAAFFTFRDGLVASVRMYYNAADWLRQVS